MNLLGAILAGGRSSRFGTDKAYARMIDGRTLIDHAMASLGAHVDTIIVCGRTMNGVTAIADRPEHGLGPLGGINAALHYARKHGFTGVMTTGCDMPVFPAELAQALVGENPAVLDGQPLASYWPATLASALDAHLARDNNRSIRGWIADIPHRVIRMPQVILPNINRPADLTALAATMEENPNFATVAGDLLSNVGNAVCGKNE